MIDLLEYTSKIIAHNNLNNTRLRDRPFVY